MPKVRFQSVCPAHECKDNETYTWAHYNCPGGRGELYLDNRAMITCSSCPLEDFVFRCQFDCGKRNGIIHRAGFEYGCFQGFLACLSSLSKLENPPGNFIVEVTGILMDHKNEFRENFYSF